MFFVIYPFFYDRQRLGPLNCIHDYSFFRRMITVTAMPKQHYIRGMLLVGGPTILVQGRNCTNPSTNLPTALAPVCTHLAQGVLLGGKGRIHYPLRLGAYTPYSATRWTKDQHLVAPASRLLAYMLESSCRLSYMVVGLWGIRCCPMDTCRTSSLCLHRAAAP